MISRIEQKEQHKRLVAEVADEVLSRLTATVDISSVLMEIDELRQAIDSLGK